MKPKTTSRHGKRAAGKTSTTISLREDLLAKARIQAEKEGRSLSNFIEMVLKAAVPDRAGEDRAGEDRAGEDRAGAR